MIFKTVLSIRNHKIIILAKTYISFFSSFMRMLSFSLLSIGYVCFSFWYFFVFKLHMYDFVTVVQFSLVSLTLMSCLLVLVILLLLHHNTRESRLGKKSYISIMVVYIYRPWTADWISFRPQQDKASVKEICFCPGTREHRKASEYMI